MKKRFEVPQDYLELKAQLYEASIQGEQESVHAVLSRCGRLLNCLYKQGMTPLMLAASHGHVALTSALLERGADLSAENGSTRHTALFCAIAGGHIRVVRTLVESGANLHARDSNQYIPLTYAMSKLKGASRYDTERQWRDGIC